MSKGTQEERIVRLEKRIILLTEGVQEVINILEAAGILERLRDKQLN